MNCPKCGSMNVNAQVINETQLKAKHHSIFWWMLIGFWWVPIKWLVFTIPALFVKIFAPKKYKTKNRARSMWVCQSCGHTWKA